MSERPTTTRRALLGTASGIAGLGLAGCLGYSGSGGGGDGRTGAPTVTPTPEATATVQEADGHHEEEEHHEDEQAHEEGGHGSGGPADHVVVEMLTNDTGHHFHPHVAWVKPGGTVEFHNASGTHTATAYHPDNGKPLRMPEGAEPFDSGLLTEAGETFEHTFELEGVYDIYCAPHETLGMIGTVLVGEPDPHDQPGLAEPQSEFRDRAATKIADLNHQVNETLGHTHGEATATATEHHEEDDHHEETPSEHHEGTETAHSN